MRAKGGYIYIVSNKNRTVLYIGVTLICTKEYGNIKMAWVLYLLINTIARIFYIMNFSKISSQLLEGKNF